MADMLISPVNHNLPAGSTPIYQQSATMVYMETIGNRLKLLREARGISQVQAAKVAETTKQAVSQIENGRTANPGGLTLYAWSEYYGVDLKWLVTGTAPRQSQPLRITPEIIGCTQEVLEIFLGFVGQVTVEKLRDPLLLATTLTLVIACEGGVKDIDRTRLAIRLADILRGQGEVNASESGVIGGGGHGAGGAVSVSGRQTASEPG